MKVQVSRSYACFHKVKVTFLVDDAAILDYHSRNGINPPEMGAILDPWSAICFLKKLCQHEIMCNSLDSAVTEVKVRVVDQPQLPGKRPDYEASTKEAQDAFTALRDEVLSSHGPLEVNEVLDIIDAHTPDWV